MLSISTPPKKWIRDGRVTAEKTKESIDFIKENRLWEGFKSYTWLVKALMIGGLLLSINVISSWRQLLQSADEAESSASLLNLFDGVNMESLASFSDGSMKYVILILLEVVIFHFTRRSLMAVTGEKIDTSFATFIKAEKRMILVAIFSLFAEKVFMFISSAGLSIVQLSMLKPVAFFVIQSFYLGFAMVDNYNEIYKMTIKQSHRYTWQFAPVALIVGAMLNVAIQIPVLGFMIGPIFCSVIGTLAMHQLAPNRNEMAWVYVEKKKPKRKKRQ